ncbi:MAG: hypothetical protein HZB80_08575 [Deltaproteobacteria bacterium]|nr:hypothetical protein [Deltaproteobacteria bacterium]
MKFDIFLNETANIKSKNIILTVLLCALGVVVAVNSYFTYRAIYNQRIVVIPVSALNSPLHEKIEVGTTWADEKYIHMMGKYMAGLFLSYTPSTIHAQYAELLGLFTPSLYVNTKTKLSDAADNVANSRIVSVFFIYAIKYKTDGSGMLKIEITGTQILYNKDQKVHEENEKYTFSTRIDNGKLSLYDIKKGGIF